MVTSGNFGIAFISILKSPDFQIQIRSSLDFLCKTRKESAPVPGLSGLLL